MTNSTPGPHVGHDESHFPALHPSKELDQWSYILDKTLVDLEKAIRAWFHRVISGKAPYASPGEPPLSQKNVL